LILKFVSIYFYISAIKTFVKTRRRLCDLTANKTSDMDFTGRDYVTLSDIKAATPFMLRQNEAIANSARGSDAVPIRDLAIYGLADFSLDFFRPKVLRDILAGFPRGLAVTPLFDAIRQIHGKIIFVAHKNAPLLKFADTRGLASAFSGVLLPDSCSGDDSAGNQKEKQPGNSRLLHITSIQLKNSVIRGKSTRRLLNEH
jgi:hypothetical protein